MFPNETLLKTAATVAPNLANTVKLSPSQTIAGRIPRVTPSIPPVSLHPPVPVPAPPAPVPAPPAAAPPPAQPAPSIPSPPAGSPFASLPFPNPGDRIKADDFKALSQSLNILYGVGVLSASLFGVSFADAKAALAGQRYSIERVMTVFGSELANPTDTSFDSRKVIQVIPAAPGDPRVCVVVTESVDTRRFAPNLIGLTYRDAQSKIQTLLADVTITGAPPTAPQLTGLTLTAAEQSSL